MRHISIRRWCTAACRVTQKVHVCPCSNLAWMALHAGMRAHACRQWRAQACKPAAHRTEAQVQWLTRSMAIRPVPMLRPAVLNCSLLL